MDRPGDSQKPPPQAVQDKKPVSSLPPSFRILYLAQYNFLAALLWASILIRTIVCAAGGVIEDVYPALEVQVKWTQTLAALEVVHAAVGFVRAPLLTTAMQVASRFLLVWLIAPLFPATVSASPAYTSMLLAWSVTEVIRYSYFAVSLSYSQNAVPEWLTWLRYNAFFVLYPLGISSECWLVWLSEKPGAERFGWLWRAFVWGVLAIYVPGSYVLYTHMMTQRRKVLKNMKQAEKKPVPKTGR